MSTVGHQLFSSEGIDTTDFIPFVSDCRYFNDTYLKYSYPNGENPIDSIATNLTKLISGDLTGITATYDRYRRYAGTYKANTTNKAWEKVEGNQPGDRIALIFNDQAGTEMRASLSWLSNANGQAMPDSVNDPNKPEGNPTAAKNIITITDLNGNLITDTIPEKIELSITGGKNDINFTSTIFINVIGTNLITLSTRTVMGSYAFETTVNAYNYAERRTTILTKGGIPIISIDKNISGENLISYIADPAKYPLTQKNIETKVYVMDKIVVEKYADEAKIAAKKTELRKAGYTTTSKEYVEGLNTVASEAIKEMVYDKQNNTYIGSIIVKPYYETTHSIWIPQNFITLNDNSSYSLNEFDTSGLLTYFQTKLDTLFSRITNLLE